MEKTRKRRIVRRAVMALVACALVAWLLREPPEIDKSRAIKLGMQEHKVELAMGAREKRWTCRDPLTDSRWLIFGETTGKRAILRQKLNGWIGSVYPLPPIPFESWPVRVRVTPCGVVDRIERGNEVEEAPPQ